MIRRFTGYALEAVLGLFIGALVVWVLAATVQSVPFVYQGY
ncbi:MAG: hypothetical protein AAGC53_03510 [Actinomycetota bacterium]